MSRLTFFLALALGLGCQGWSPDSGDDSSAKAKRQSDEGEIAATIRKFKTRDPSMERFFDSAHAYAIWPSVGKGGFVIGGGGGRGAVYEKGKLIGFSTITFVTIGAQIGGQEFAEVIFFKDKAALDNFKRGNYELAAQVTAVAAQDGVARDASYDSGVAIFTLPLTGVMAEASVGGQKFSYDPR